MIIKKRANKPAFPISKKNQTLPVKLITNGIAYRGFLNISVNEKNVPYTFPLMALDWTEGVWRIG